LELLDTSPSRTDQDWLNAKSYKEVPGPSPLRVLSYFLPGGNYATYNYIYSKYHPILTFPHLPTGKLHNMNLIQMNRRMREMYGNIYRFPMQVRGPKPKGRYTKGLRERASGHA